MKEVEECVEYGESTERGLSGNMKEGGGGREGEEGEGE